MVNMPHCVWAKHAMFMPCGRGLWPTAAAAAVLCLVTDLFRADLSTSIPIWAAAAPNSLRVESVAAAAMCCGMMGRACANYMFRL